jgi:serine/threonine protein kinase
MMEDDTLVHPDAARLTAFGHATLDDDDMAEVESHLAVCESCCQVLATFPDDEFARSLRTARTSSLMATGLWCDAGLAATAPNSCGGTGFDIPSSFVLTGSDPDSKLNSTIAASGSSVADERDLPVEQELPLELLNHSRYGIVRKLGIGGMGSVYLAQHRVMDRPVALKVIRPDLLDNATLVERFRREVKSAARLATHPNIVAAYDAEQAGDSHFLVMEFVDGVDLGHLVKRQGPLSCEEACKAIKQAAEGLEHACQRGMVHRDIKPQNLMRTPDGQVKILDFGLARFASEALPDLVPAAGPETETTTRDHGGPITLTDMLLGTADYIAPEQASAPRSADIRADIYSLGCTLYYLLAGHPPFPDGNLAQKLASHAELTPKPLTEVRPDVPAELAVIVDRMMAKDRSLRFQRPADVADALAPFADPRAAKMAASSVRESKEEGSPRAASHSSFAETGSGPPPWPTPSSYHRPRRRLVKVATVLSLFVASAGTLAVWIQLTQSRAPDQMMRPAAPPGPFINASSESSSQAIDSAEVVRRLKDATVYIKNNIAGKTLASGTGFVIEVQGDTVILATNLHVAVLDISEIPPRFVPKGSTPEIEAVFRSGQGPQNEQALPAKIIAADTSGDFSNDLAFLRVKGVKRPPTPINVLTKSETTEGMAYTGAGFPFGGMLSNVTESKGNPSVTITRGGIAALRRDEHGQLDLFQVVGSLQPGNSGGPIVEEKTGKFIGMAVRKVGAAANIGFVIPASELRRALAGRVGALDLTLQAIQDNIADLQITAQIFDPKGAVKKVWVCVASASAGNVSPNGDGSWPPLPNSTHVELQRDTKLAMASGRIQVALSEKGSAARKFLIQTASRDVNGRIVFSKPMEFDLPEKPGRVLPPGQLQRTLKAVNRKSYTMLGPLIDPDKDCRLIKDEDSMKLKIEIPGGKVRSLAPEVLSGAPGKKPLHNAPMSVIEVEGDFAALVEVTGDMSPGSSLPEDRQGNDIPFTFQGAGLLLYQDKDNFVRLERTAGVAVEGLHKIHKLLFEVVKDGKRTNDQIYADLLEEGTLLILIKRRGAVRCMFSQDGGKAIVACGEIKLDLPPKVKIGLSASNISAKPFSASFESFAIITDVTSIDQIFGDSTSH